MMDLRPRNKRQRLSEPTKASAKSQASSNAVDDEGPEFKDKLKKALNIATTSKLNETEQQQQQSTSMPIALEVAPSDAKDLTLRRVTGLMETWTTFKCRPPQHTKFFDQLSDIMRGYGNYVKDRGSRRQTHARKVTLPSERLKQKIVSKILHRDTVTILNGSASSAFKKNLKRLQGNNFMASSSSTINSRLDKKENDMRKELLKKKRKELNNQIQAERIAVEKVMANHLTAKIIFQHLSVKDLLNCSQVSTSWNANARLVLRKDKKCFAIINFRNTCRRLRAFKQMIENCTAIPFNGISIDYSCYSCRNYRNAPPNVSMNSSLVLDPNKITIKYLKILNWRINSHCPIFHLIRSIFVHHAGNLQEITLRLLTSENYTPVAGLAQMLATPQQQQQQQQEQQQQPLDPSASSTIVVNSNLLPKLKELTLPEGQLTSFATVVNDIIFAAPNLEKIINKVYLNIVRSLVVNQKAHIVKKFCFMPLRAEDLQLSCDFARQPLQVEEMTVSSGTCFNVASFASVQGVMRMLYTSSQNSIKYLDMTQVDLLMLAAPTIPSLSGVKRIQLHYNGKLDGILGYRSLSRVNYAGRLPNLDTVCVDRLDPISLINGARQLPNEFRTMWANAPEFTCSSVSRLKFELQPSLNYGEDDLMERRMIQSFPSVFCHVTHLHLHRATDFPQIFQHLWTSWRSLESITISGIEDNDCWRNFDSIFTGISEENCKILRDTGNYQDYQKLQVQPSIANLSNLKLLRLHIHHQHIKCEDDEDSTRNIFLTQVTGRCAFVPMRLRVEISRDSCQYRLKDKRCYLTLDCLQPFVKFTHYSYDVPKGWQWTDD